MVSTVVVEKDIDRYATTYSSLGGYEREMVRLRRAHALRSMARHPHRHVLEIGCGLEPSFLFYDDYESHTTVEPAESFFAAACAAANTHPRVTVERAFIEDFRPARAEPFDFILASGMLHEVADPAAVLRAVHGLATKDTVVHMSVPNARSFHRLLAYEMGLLRDLFTTSDLGRSLQRRTEFDRTSLVELVTSHGFEVFHCETYAWKPFTHAQMQVLLDSPAFPPGLAEGLDRMTKYLPEHGAELFVEMRRAGTA